MNEVDVQMKILREHQDGLNDIPLLAHLDHASMGHFTGWAVDRERPSTQVVVELFVGNRLLAQFPAAVATPDVTNLGYPGDHGFDFYYDPVDADVDDEIRLRVSRANSKDVAVDLRIDDQKFPDIHRYMVIDRSASFILKSTSSLILFDIQDLVNYLLNHNSVTGIQRVVGGFMQEKLSQKTFTEEKLFFCMMSDKEGGVSESNGVRIFDDKGLAEIVEIAMDGGCPIEILREKVLFLKRRAYGYQPKAGDTYFIGGAYWIVPDFGVRLNALKDQNVAIGTYIYDLIPITSPQWVTDETRRSVSERAIDVMLISDFFLTISDFVKDDLERLLEFELGDIRPITAVPLPHVLPPRVRSVKNGIRSSMKSLKRFVLCVCTLEGRKNHILLFRIWAALLRKNAHEEVPELVLVGKWGWNIHTFQQALVSTDYLDSKIKIFENIGDEELQYLYEQCMFTVFPSFMEGWGLPVGESLSVGKLCVASNISSIPEVGGTFCDYLDPHDFYQAYKVISRVIFDQDYLDSRNQVIKNSFVPRSWQEYSDNLVQTIRSESARIRQKIAHAPIMMIEPLTLYDLTEAALVADQRIGWRNKALKFSLRYGWFKLENWGCWSHKNKASINISVKQQLADVGFILLIELRSAVSLEVSARAVISEGSSSSIISLSTRPKWYAFKVGKGSSSREIMLTAQFEPLEEPHRKLYIGISRLLIVEKGQQQTDGVPFVALEKLGMLG